VLKADQRQPLKETLPPGSEVMLLEDDGPFRKRIAVFLRNAGANVTEAGRIDEARRLLEELRFDYALIDMHLPDGDAVALLKEGAISETTGVVVMTAFGGIRRAVEAIRLGADDYLSKPFEPDEVPLAFMRCRRTRLAERRAEHRRDESTAKADRLFFGESLRQVRRELDTILAADRRLASNLPPILIEGETGTGKSVLARWIHMNGPRSRAPFISINCAALAETLAESELFGHERGAFTDAKGARMGLFEAADGGTLFLDEIGSLSPSIQAKLLTAVEDRSIRRVGGTREFAIEVRLMAASNRPLDGLVQKNLFREDLLHRLKLVSISLPPLRERGSDILLLAQHLLAILAARYQIKAPPITEDGAARLLAQSWNGNVRELSHEIERALIFGGTEPLDFLPLGGLGAQPRPPWRNPSWIIPSAGFSLEEAVNDLISEALRESNNNVSSAARRLGVTRDYVRYRLPKLRENGSGNGAAHE
jgi:DNA-binding NtrC family response regulator